jgi:hypothetical protein
MKDQELKIEDRTGKAGWEIDGLSNPASAGEDGRQWPLDTVYKGINSIINFGYLFSVSLHRVKVRRRRVAAVPRRSLARTRIATDEGPRTTDQNEGVPAKYAN